MGTIYYNGQKYTTSDSTDKEYAQQQKARENLSNWSNVLNTSKKNDSASSYKNNIQNLQNAAKSYYNMTPTDYISTYSSSNLDPMMANANAKASQKSNYLNGGSGYTSGGVNYQNTPQYSSYDQMIRDWQESAKASQLSQLKAAYDQSRSNINAQLPTIEQSAQQALNQNEVDYNTKYRPQMLASLEQSGAYGGGDMASGTQGLLTALQNNQNQILTEKADQIQQLQKALQDLETQQAAGESQISSGIDAEALNKLMTAAQQAQQQANTDREFYSDQSYKNAMLNIDQGKAQQESLANQAQIIAMANYDNIQSEIDRRKSANPNDPLIPYLEAQRQQKIKTQKQSQAAATEATYKKWLEEQKLELDKKKTNYEINKPYYNTSTKTSYKDNPDFIADYSGVVQNGANSYDEVMANSQTLIAKYGVDGFNALLNAAKAQNPYYRYGQ